MSLHYAATDDNLTPVKTPDGKAITACGHVVKFATIISSVVTCTKCLTKMYGEPEAEGAMDATPPSHNG